MLALSLKTSRGMPFDPANLGQTGVTACASEHSNGASAEHGESLGPEAPAGIANTQMGHTFRHLARFHVSNLLAHTSQ